MLAFPSATPPLPRRRDLAAVPLACDDRLDRVEARLDDLTVDVRALLSEVRALAALLRSEETP